MTNQPKDAIQVYDDIYGFQEQISKAREESRATGEPRKLQFDKAKFMEQYPAVAADPRFSMLSDVFTLDIQQYEAIRVGELRELCKQVSPEHATFALQKRQSVMALPDNHVVYIQRHEVIALRQGKGPSTIIVPAMASPTTSTELQQPPTPPGGLNVEAATQVAKTPKEVIDAIHKDKTAQGGLDATQPPT